MGTGWLLASCMEARGKQDLWTRQKPEVLRALREQSIVQSVESSNRIEGVTVSPDRLLPVVLGRAKPRDRSEEELAGYRRALDWIFSRKRPPALSPELVRKLHALAQSGSVGDAGDWKKRDNQIIELPPTGEPRVRFVPTSARATPAAMDRLCRNYAEACRAETVPPLLIVATFVFDFLCIHPFRDGNGRVARLVTLLLLYHLGYEVGRYISLERLIEDSKATYYDSLALSDVNWVEGRHDHVPFTEYLLGIVLAAYRELEDNTAHDLDHGARGRMVERAVEALPVQFRLADVEKHCPLVGRDTIRTALAKLKKDGKITSEGRGRAASWRRLV